NNVPTGVIDLGGNIYAVGTKNDGSLWRIGIRDPITEGGTPVARIEAINQSVVTSGAYERFFEQDGKRFHHILDTKTGYPAQSDVASFTIINESSLISDVLSTTAFILGKSAGLAFLEQENILGLCITNDKKIFPTKGFSQNWDILSAEYSP
ncbi:MAG: FAD:protein FMN transferase, partial [Treponemataceae bacterium]